MNRRQLQSPFLRVVIRDCPHGGEGHWIRVWKAWWQGPGLGGTQRSLFDYCIPRQDGDEAEALARAFESIAAALRG